MPAWLSAEFAGVRRVGGLSVLPHRESSGGKGKPDIGRAWSSYTAERYGGMDRATLDCGGGGRIAVLAAPSLNDTLGCTTLLFCSASLFFLIYKERGGGRGQQRYHEIGREGGKWCSIA